LLISMLFHVKKVWNILGIVHGVCEMPKLSYIKNNHCIYFEIHACLVNY